MLYKEDLDNLQCFCGRPACEDPVFLHSVCHAEEPTWCEYFNGVLTVKCAECGQVVAEVAVREQSGG